MSCLKPRVQAEFYHPVIAPDEKTWQKFHSPSVSVRSLTFGSKPITPRLLSSFYLSKYRDAIRQIDPNHLVLRPRKMHSGQRFSYLALPPEETRAINAAYHQRIHRDQSSLIPLDPEAFIQKALDLLASERYLEKGMALMALTGRRLAEIFFSASFSLPHKKLPFPALIFEGQLKTRQAPGTAQEPYPIPVLADPKKIIQALDRLRALKSIIESHRCGPIF